MRLLLRGLGQTLITAGLIVLLFVVYEVWVTNFFAHREQVRVHQALQRQWANCTQTLCLPDGELKPIVGDGIANLYIPRFGLDYAWTVVQGDKVPTDSQLEEGPAHYADTAMPGEAGNFAIAGHRVGKGEPFLNLDQLQAGDPVVVETRTKWYVYCVLGTAPGANPCDPNAAGASLSARDANGVPGREIVSPDDGDVLLPVPNDTRAHGPYTVKYLTMTTCTPKFTAAQRMIVHASLQAEYDKAQTGDNYSNAVPAPINAYYSAGEGN
ncbi:MAG: class E sortase [Jatrophihabitans sp.]|nr:MAG: class E sortase [Jatrophihabitans sp.]